MAVIEVDGLTKRFARLTAVDHVTFTVERGRVVGFLGPNGAGKTTTLRMLLGLVTPTSGTATINGRRYADLAAPLHAVGAALESSLAYPGRSARNHLRIAALVGGAAPSRVDEVLDVVDLAGAADRRVGQFSLGMRQRLALATALVCDPEILILDEPANGLDPEGVHWLRTLLRRLAGEGRTVLVSSHILAEVAQTVDSVVILDGGRLVTESTLADLTAGGTQVVRVRTPRAADLAGLLTVRGATATVVAADRVEIAGATSELIGTVAAEHAIPIFETTNGTADLEDIFLRLTAGADRTEVAP
ncbi:MAG TPA: ABC transporter ATP-binding protein [Acidimicrobiales bacterium]|nr:ABC transporter ATP-binding protein [Acidimicrobiales bacterium]